MAEIIMKFYEHLPRLVLQIFSYTKKQALQTDDVCLDVSSLHGPVKLFQCHGLGGNQKWEYDRQVNISPGAEECIVGGITPHYLCIS